MQPVDLGQLKAALFRMGSGKAAGVDEVKPRHLKMAFPVIGPVLLDVVNSSIVEGKFPETWKTGLISPIEKIPEASNRLIFVV